MTVFWSMLAMAVTSKVFNLPENAVKYMELCITMMLLTL
jgi:hypothetical protein